jgi:hypothetical protein
VHVVEFNHFTSTTIHITQVMDVRTFTTIHITQVMDVRTFTTIHITQVMDVRTFTTIHITQVMDVSHSNNFKFQICTKTNITVQCM